MVSFQNNYILKSKEPFQFIACIFSYKDYIKNNTEIKGHDHEHDNEHDNDHEHERVLVLVLVLMLDALRGASALAKN